MQQFKGFEKKQKKLLTNGFEYDNLNNLLRDSKNLDN